MFLKFAPRLELHHALMPCPKYGHKCGREVKENVPKIV